MLTHCPICNYNLHGLPQCHTCPECGFEYDGRMVVVWQGNRFAWFALFFFGLSGLGNLPIGFVIGGRAWWYTVLSLGMLHAAWRGARSLFLQRKNRVVVGPQGVMTVDVGGAVRLYAWAAFARAEYQVAGGGVVLVGETGRPVGVIGYDFLGSTQRVRLAIAVINGFRNSSTPWATVRPRRRPDANRPRGHL